MKLNEQASWSIRESDLSGKVQDDLSLYFVQYPRQRETGFVVYCDCVEPDFLLPNFDDNMLNNIDLYLTRKKSLVEKYPDKCKLFYFGTCWIKSPQDLWKEKTPTVSFTTTSKYNPHAFGYQLRHQIAENFCSLKNACSLETLFFNSSFVPFPESKVNCKPIYKLNETKDVLMKSMFSIVVENQRCEGYFSEKLIDALQTKTVPIYYGTCPSEMENLFDTKGILFFENIDELHRILESLSSQKYVELMEHVERNYLLSSEYAGDFPKRLVRAINEA